MALTEVSAFKNLSIVNDDINGSAAIAGTKISPDFGSQDITTTGDIKIDSISKSLQIGDITGDNYAAIQQVSASTVRGFTIQHSNASVFENLQGSTNQHIVLGDVNTNSSTTLFGVSITSGGIFTRLSLSGSGNLNVHNNITLGGTVDGVDIAARDTLFGGLTSSSGVLTNGVTATTQSAGDNSTKIATTAYVDGASVSTEQVQDIVGAMFTGNTETNITATYQDSDGTIDLVASGGGGGSVQELTRTSDSSVRVTADSINGVKVANLIGLYSANFNTFYGNIQGSASGISIFNSANGTQLKLRTKGATGTSELTKIAIDDDVTIYDDGGTGSNPSISATFVRNGAVSLHHAGSSNPKIFTTANGVTVNGSVTTQDINMSNLNAYGNEVDNTKGSWTIQEGASDLFLINRVNGKKYKFNLTEIS